MTLLLDLCEPALEREEPVVVELPIRNVNRTVGTILSSEVTKKYGRGGFKNEDTIQLNFRGTAGQSLMAFGVHGVTVRVEGDVNDYCGKGLSGGKIIVYPPREARLWPRKTSSPATSCSTAPPAASCICGASRASGSACATAARRPSSKASATTVANT